MNNTDVLFYLDKASEMIVRLDVPMVDFDSCSEASIYLKEAQKELLLSHNSLYENMFILNNALNKALDGEQQLHPSITEDIGFLLNQEWQDKPGLAYEKFGNRDYWVGHKYMLWNYECATWLYNDSKGQIVFEVTPIYPGNWQENYVVSYDEWIKSYKPILTRIIPRDVAQMWKDKAEFILKQIEKSMKEFDEQERN